MLANNIISYFIVNLEFGWVKYWRMTFVSTNTYAKVFAAKILHYTVSRLLVVSHEAKKKQHESVYLFSLEIDMYIQCTILHTQTMYS